ncbi:MAG: tRNA (adenosine(37)-N6)-dimethylallyltransferase MiaA [Candidatus Brennerbacteria bacterium]|nr:tRNA (adenosine(37)-N6)-dimethylallyltransferase MiaA [Candidatus Brennerbacteria bacterium]
MVIESNRRLPALIAIVGATGTGKSALAVALAKQFGGEIISADSRQVYRDLNIGTGKLTKHEMRGLPHHLLDVTSLRRTYTAQQYQRTAQRVIKKVWRRGKLPILCGGTGLYVNAVLNGTVFPEVPPNRTLRSELKKKKIEELFTLLKKKDPRRAREIDRHNPRRLIRALEIVEAQGKVPAARAKPIEARTLIIGLALPTETLERRTRARIQSWLRRGLLRETVDVPQRHISELGLVYRWALRFARNEIPRAAFIEGLTHNLLAYAKRQQRWFERDPRVIWVAHKREALLLAKRFLK